MDINQMVNGRVVPLWAVAHDGTAPGAADYISEKNHRVANRPAEGQPCIPHRDSVVRSVGAVRFS